MSMRSEFYRYAGEALEQHERMALVLADIGVAQLPKHPRVFNVGIREQLMIGVAAGLAMEGYRPVVHSYTPFLVERPYEQVKLDLGHQDVGAVLVSYGASYDGAREGRTHQAPEDIAILSALPGWTLQVPGHPDEAERMLMRALETDDRVYIRLSDEENDESVAGDGLVLLRDGPGPFVIAVGPTLGPTLAATAGLDLTVSYLSTVRPFPADALRATLRGTDVVIVEPYLSGTSAAEISAALSDRPHRLLSLGVPNAEFRHYGDPQQHRAAHGLDASGIRAAIDRFVTSRVTRARRSRS